MKKLGRSTDVIIHSHRMTAAEGKILESLFLVIFFFANVQTLGKKKKFKYLASNDFIVSTNKLHKTISVPSNSDRPVCSNVCSIDSIDSEGLCTTAFRPKDCRNHGIFFRKLLVATRTTRFQHNIFGKYETPRITIGRTQQRSDMGSFVHQGISSP